MRCFLAVDLPKKVKDEIEKIQKQLPEKDLKKVEKENLHLTLKFFGEIDDKKINEIKEKIKDFKFEKIKCNLGTIGVFPSSSFIRVVWVSLEPQDKIKELAKKINEKLNSRDDRFESHITLARIKFLKNKKEFIEKLKEIKVNPIEMTIDSFSLKKSTLTEKGPVYETIIEFKI